MLTHSLSGQHIENEMPLFAQVCHLEILLYLYQVNWFLLQYKRDSPNDDHDAFDYINDYDDQRDEHYEDHFEPGEYSDDDFGDLGWYHSLV